MNARDGIVLDIQRGALRDGPGVRTTVFLKGCPLRCLWCHNPESQKLLPETGRGGKRYGRRVAAEQVMDEVLRDAAYYRASGGGLTVSGGEPTTQYAFCRTLLTAARAAGIHTCLDTSGHCEPERFRALLPLVDLCLFDYKATGDALHRRLTGQGLGWISANIGALSATGAFVRLRCPLVPGVNDSAGHFAGLAAVARQLPGLQGIDLLAYHAWGEAKARDLGLTPASPLETRAPTEADRRRWLELAAANGLAVALD